MRNRSTIDMVVEDTLRELEYEFENGEGVEFDSPSSVPNYKWMIYTSTSLSGGPWKLIGQEIAPKWMDHIDAGKYGKALLITKAFLRKIMPLGIARIAIQPCCR